MFVTIKIDTFMFAKARQRDDKPEKLIYTVTGKGNKWQLSESIGIGFCLENVGYL